MAAHPAICVPRNQGLAGLQWSLLLARVVLGWLHDRGKLVEAKQNLRPFVLSTTAIGILPAGGNGPVIDRTGSLGVLGAEPEY